MTNCIDHFSTIPKESIRKIFSYLTKEDLLTCKSVSRFFNFFVKSDYPCLSSPLNKVIVCKNVAASKLWKEELLMSANQDIRLSGNFCGGRIFRRYLAIISSRLREKSALQVNLICSKILLEKQDFRLLTEIQSFFKRRFNCLVTTPKRQSNGAKLENHVKLLVVDHTYFVVGGSGCQDNLLSVDPNFKPATYKAKFTASAHQDMDLVGRGPFARTLSNYFSKLFSQLSQLHRQPFDALRFSSKETIGGCRAFDRDPSQIQNVSLSLYTSFPNQHEDAIVPQIAEVIREAKTSVVMATLGFSPPQPILDALHDRKSAAKTTVITNSPQASKACIRLYGVSSAPFFRYVDELYLYEKKGVLYHTKVITIDAGTTLIGSRNLTSSSGSFEIMVKVSDPRVTSTVLEQLNQDTAFSSRSHAESQGVVTTVLGKTINAWFREYL